MGKIIKGILGGFTGLVGTVVGSNWRGLDTMRSRPKKSNKPATVLQLTQRMSFDIMVGFVGEIKDLIQVGFQSHTNGMTPYNAAMKANLLEGITGVYPSLSINYPEIVISKGGLRPLVGLGAASTVAGEAVFSWTSNAPVGHVSATDKITICVYCPTLNEFATVENIALRTAASYEMSLPASFSGEDCHAWCYFASANSKKVCDSKYVAITVL